VCANCDRDGFKAATNNSRIHYPKGASAVEAAGGRLGNIGR
jgi:hypothetical protein